MAISWKSAQDCKLRQIQSFWGHFWNALLFYIWKKYKRWHILHREGCSNYSFSNQRKKPLVSDFSNSIFGGRLVIDCLNLRYDMNQKRLSFSALILEIYFIQGQNWSWEQALKKPMSTAFEAHCLILLSWAHSKAKKLHISSCYNFISSLYLTYEPELSQHSTIFHCFCPKFQSIQENKSFSCNSIL